MNDANGIFLLKVLIKRMKITKIINEDNFSKNAGDIGNRFKRTGNNSIGVRRTGENNNENNKL